MPDPPVHARPRTTSRLALTYKAPILMPLMNKPELNAAAGGRLLGLLALLFVCSGAAALIYEIVWFQLLELVIGSSAISLAVLLASYMGGMCIGSFFLPRLVRADRHPLRVYAWLELGIGACAILILLLLPLVRGVYSAIGDGSFGIVLRALISALCLMPPTILMGATLPAVSRWVESTPRGFSWLGLLYGANTMGAVLGSVLAGFYLLRVYDLSTATFVAMAINVAVALVAFAMARPRSAPATAATVSNVRTHEAREVWPTHLVIALSGASALGAQVIWTRLLSLLLGGTVYTFSLILAVILAGLGIGSAIGARWSRTATQPLAMLGWCQVALTVTIAWAALLIGKAFPYWPINPQLAPSVLFNLQIDLARCFLAIFPASLFWGMSFPLALGSVQRLGRPADRAVAGVYAANTLGAIAGALLFSLTFVPLIGTQRSQQLLIAICAIGAALAFGAFAREELSPTAAASRRAGLATTLAVSLLAIVVTPKVPGLLVAYGRWMVTWIGRSEPRYVGEGRNSSVAVTQATGGGTVHFHVSGKVEASTFPEDMRLQRMLAHLPALIHPNPQSVLIVGFGAGVTAGSFVPYPTVTQIVICEIEPLIPKVVSRFFSRENNDVVNDPRVRIIYDDARSMIITTRQKFDIITSDPINPWVKGAASLYTREYFEAVKAHLNPGGVVSQWVPLYESTVDAVRSELATFFEVFPHATVWANLQQGGGYDLVLIGQNEPTRIDFDALYQRADERYRQVAASLIEVGLPTPIALFSTYAGSAADLKAWLAGSEINRDRNLRLQYLAASGVNRYESRSIFDQIIAHRTVPETLFTGDPIARSQLFQSFSR